MIDPEDGPATNEATTKDGRRIDLNNLPGKVKQDLIEKGVIEENRFYTPPNLPGKKLKEYREQRGIVAEGEPKPGVDAPNPFVKGDIVIYKGKTVEVSEVDERRVMIEYETETGKEKKVWVHWTKVDKG